MQLDPRVLELLETIKKQASISSPEEVELVSQIISDSMILSAKALSGENVDEEVKIVYATMLNIADGKRQVVVTHILNFVNSLIVGIVQKALLGV